MLEAGLMPRLAKLLSVSDADLQVFLTSILAKVSQEKDVDTAIRKVKGLSPLVALLQSQNKQTLYALTTSLFRLSAPSPQNTAALVSARCLKALEPHVSSSDKKLAILATACVASLLRSQQGRSSVKGSPLLLSLIKHT
ncbi:hypothetical protein KIPB_012605, partial [Kipferlia bialata]|eukprot:g12605.t1